MEVAYDRLLHDLRAAGQDADRHAVSVLDMLALQPPSALLVGSPVLLDLLKKRLVCLLGCLAMASRTTKRLNALGVLL